ncbi:uncharacterized protein BO97DRAFT_114009 [Aspergillus homomorphus CBS 101889]|uniref:Uncharacterized protein n=1 Tax=Aspergillus homomorphus (strain CBS 101889) TaxID=1450537 RepID=A0A395HVF7_ASPHC|nr:hypothetical protein BO97DRAFT_114009 [Aspergillus homomorphus CBS 101889]RAL10828.1 hypothetical protein BO97DRAFT_114009 [Aspergillus homomorphus CBS 101889]
MRPMTLQGGLVYFFLVSLRTPHPSRKKFQGNFHHACHGQLGDPDTMNPQVRIDSSPLARVGTPPIQGPNSVESGAASTHRRPKCAISE